MAELKTEVNDASVTAFLNGIADERKRRDSFVILDLMKKVTKSEPKMWGTAIVGFGNYTYKYATGREGSWPILGFSPRKQTLTLYIMPGFQGFESLMKKLGKHKTGKCCLYINSIEDIDLPTLEKLMRQAIKVMPKIMDMVRRAARSRRKSPAS